MLNRDYLSRLSRAARWYLGAKEAEDVIADYQELLAGDTRTEEELVRDFGKPMDVAKQLVERKAYRIWLAVFVLMAGCILLMGICQWNWVLWERFFVDWPFGIHLAPIVAAAGAVTALVWCRRCGERRGQLSKAVPVLLAASLVLIGLVMLFSWACVRDLDGFRAIWGEMPALLGPARMVSISMELSRYMLMCSPLFLVLAGIFALVKVRTGDRRWAAVYVLAMTAILVSLEALATVYNMGIDVSDEVMPVLMRANMVFTALGLAGMGVALC